MTSPSCCSSAPTTPGAAWPPGSCSTTTPTDASTYAPPGSEPADQLNPSVVAVLQERGLDPTGEHPKLLTADDGLAADVIVTMGCGDTCPVYPGKRYLDWDLPDPAGQPIEAVRPIVDDIDRRVQALLDELTRPDTP